MENIKTELEVDPLPVSGYVYIEEIPVSEEVDPLTQTNPEIKEECSDYTILSDVKFEETTTSFSFTLLKTESVEEDSLNKNISRVKEECIDYTGNSLFNVKTEETPTPSFQLLKNETVEELQDTVTVKDELNLKKVTHDSQVPVERTTFFHNTTIPSIRTCNVGGNTGQWDRTHSHHLTDTIPSIVATCQENTEDESAKATCIKNLKLRAENGICVDSGRNSKIKPKYVIPDKKYIRCDVCGKNISRSNLKIHKRIHTGVKPFKCEVCLKTFTLSGHLKDHTRRHIGVKPFKCDECDKTFVRSSDLTVHSRTHTGVKPYKCDVCFKTFAQSSNLTGHKRTHTGVRPFKCEVCLKSFARPGKLKDHARIHTAERPFKCHVCFKSFTNSKKLNAHLCTHPGYKPYKCDDCFKTYSRPRLLRIHSCSKSRVKLIKCDVSD